VCVLAGVMETRIPVEGFLDRKSLADKSDDSHSEDRRVGRLISLEARHVDPETHLTHSERPSSDTEGAAGPPRLLLLDTEDHVGERRFDRCVQEVRRLESRREGLLGELLRVHAPMLQVVARLRRQADEARRLLAPVQLGHAALCEDARRVKRKLFRATRGCVQSQVTLAAQEYEVAQSSVTQVR